MSPQNTFKKTRGGATPFSQKNNNNSILPLDKKTTFFFFFLLNTAPTTCRDGWLGFLFRWRTQQRAISGINCRIILLPNLWTQMAHGRSPSWAIPVHAILSVEQNKKKKRRKRGGFKFSSLSLSFFLNKSPGSGEALWWCFKTTRQVRGRLAWCLLCVGEGECWRKASPPFFFCFLFPFSLAARLAQPNKNFLKKKHCVFLFFKLKIN